MVSSFEPSRTMTTLLLTRKRGYVQGHDSVAKENKKASSLSWDLQTLVLQRLSGNLGVSCSRTLNLDNQTTAWKTQLAKHLDARAVGVAYWSMLHFRWNIA